MSNIKMLKESKKPLIIDARNPPSGQNWQKVLLEIYRYAPHQYGYGTSMANNDDNHPLAKKMKISGYELMVITSFLQEQGLISDRVVPGKDRADIFWILEKKGFDVALELKKFEASQDLQSKIGYFTVILTITQVFQLFTELKLFVNWITFFIYAVVLFILAVIITQPRK